MALKRCKNSIKKTFLKFFAPFYSRFVKKSVRQYLFRLRRTVCEGYLCISKYFRNCVRSSLEAFSAVPAFMRPQYSDTEPNP